MVELIVAFTLLAIVLAIASKALVDGMASVATSTTNRKARQVTSDAVTRMEDDLYPARARHRTMDYVPEPDLLRDHILENKPLVDPYNPLVPLDVQDVNAATANRFLFQSDVRADSIVTGPVPECVEYKSRTVAGKWEFVRTVFAWTYHCAGVVVVDGPTVLARAPIAMAPPNLFFYSRYRNLNPLASPLDTTNCGSLVPALVTNVPAVRDRNSIVSITVDLRSLAQRNDGSGASAMRQSIALRTRKSRDYRHALGCA